MSRGGLSSYAQRVYLPLTRTAPGELAGFVPTSMAYAYRPLCRTADAVLVTCRRDRCSARSTQVLELGEGTGAIASNCDGFESMRAAPRQVPIEQASPRRYVVAAQPDASSADTKRLTGTTWRFLPLPNHLAAATTLLPPCQLLPEHHAPAHRRLLQYSLYHHLGNHRPYHIHVLKIQPHQFLLIPPEIFCIVVRASLALQQSSCYDTVVLVAHIQ